MLILSRKESECIHLGDDIVVTIVRVNGDKVRIGVQAPPHVKILRTELELNVVVEPTVPMISPEQSTIRRAA
jgi:carbon storage regulator